MKTENIETLESIKKHIQETQHRYVGYVKGTKSRFGFLDTADGQDIFIPPHEMDKVFAGDRISLIVKNNNGKEETFIEEILEQNFSRFVGIFIEDSTGSYVIPEDPIVNKKIRIPKSKCKNARPNQYVKAEIIEQPCVNKKPKGKILSIIGEKDAPGIENDLMIAKYGLPYKPSFNCKREVVEFDYEKIKKSFQQKHRKDLRNFSFITIDGENTMDIDDAIYTENHGDYWKLWVAISDVSEIIEHNSYIEQDAFKKTSSVYFTGKMLPMLPNEIATEICSLKEKEDKLALVAEIDISLNGEIISYIFYEAIINSKAKMNYNEVEEYIDNNSDCFINKYGELTKQIKDLYDLHQILNQNRQINYIIPEFNSDFKLFLDYNKKIKDIVPMEYKTANKIVEECMIVANTVAAQFLKTHYQKGLYKIHEGINIEKLSKLKNLLQKYFPEFKDEDLQEIETFKTILQKIKEKDDSGRLKKILMLYMNRSCYSKKPESHFGLGFEEYTYFTSPNRRYADIIVHRMIKSVLHNRKKEFVDEQLINHLNHKLRIIEEATKESEDWLKCIYMNEKRNEKFDAEIINANENIIYIRIIENGIEGMLPIALIDANYKKFYDVEFTHCINEKKFNIGDIINVSIKNINFQSKNIIFKLN